MPEIPRKTVAARTSADADERMVEIDENFMIVPFLIQQYCCVKKNTQARLPLQCGITLTCLRISTPIRCREIHEQAEESGMRKQGRALPEFKGVKGEPGDAGAEPENEEESVVPVKGKG
jgi:hypothetical protein